MATKNNEDIKSNKIHSKDREREIEQDIERTENPKRPYSISFENDPGRTQQQFAKDSDINNIMGKYKTTGILGDPLRAQRGFFGDFTNIPDYATSKAAVDEINDRFMRLPGEVRFKFDNNPQKLLDFLSDEKNVEEAVKLKLINPEPVPVKTPEQEQIDIQEEAKKKAIREAGK